jgi:hypothetical protein
MSDRCTMVKQVKKDPKFKGSKQADTSAGGKEIAKNYLE